MAQKFYSSSSMSRGSLKGQSHNSFGLWFFSSHSFSWSLKRWVRMILFFQIFQRYFILKFSPTLNCVHHRGVDTKCVVYEKISNLKQMVLRSYICIKLFLDYCSSKEIVRGMKFGKTLKMTPRCLKHLKIQNSPVY